MSKLSVHHTSPGLTTGFGDNLQKCADANSPFGTVYSLNGNIGPDIAAHSPSTKWIYRRQSDAFPRLPDGMFTSDPAANATNWLTVIKDSNDKNRTLIQNWQINSADNPHPPDWFDPLNEPVADTPAKAAWLNTWMLTALEIANSYGFKLALFSFSTGVSKDAAIWNELLPALRRGKQLGAILSLHAYWDSDPSLDHDNALRYRDIYALLPDDARLPIVISEASNGNGYNTGLNGLAWVADMALYDGELMKDSYVIGACGFQLGGSESNLVGTLAVYGDYIAAHPTPITPPPPPPPVPTGCSPAAFWYRVKRLFK